MMRDNTINFWELTGIHDETKNYVPKLIAATLIAKEPERYGFYAIPYLEPVEWETVTVPTSSDLSVIADAAEVPVETIRALNPHLLRGRTPPGELNFPVHIPAGQVQIFTQNYYQMAPDERIDIPAEHLVRTGETVIGISSAYGVDSRELMRINGLNGSGDLKDGMVLRIPGGAEPGEVAAAGPAATPPPAGSAGGSTLASTPEVRTATGRVHRVRRGDTLMGIARTYGVTLADLRRENGIRGDRLLVGQTIRIP
jgi:membrane-bound lytic murein transglycosylase D